MTTIQKIATFLLVLCNFVAFAAAQTKQNDPDLAAAAAQGEAQKVQALLNKGANPDSVIETGGDEGKPALLMAARNGHLEVVNLLLRAGADVHKMDSAKRTALMEAALEGKAAVLQILIDAGARVNDKDSWGETALTLAAGRNYRSEIFKILAKNGADINYQVRGGIKPGSTALIESVLGNFVENVQTLLDLGANPNLQLRSGQTGLDLAKKLKFNALTEILEKAGGSSLPQPAPQDRWKVLSASVVELNNQGRYTEAVPLAEEALRLAEATLGPEHPEISIPLHNLASLYFAQGQYVSAEPLFRRNLVIQEKTLGPEHPKVASSLNNLAILYQAMAKYAEAAPLCRRSLAIWEKALGPEHPNVAASLNLLASIYDDQGNYAEAEPLYRRSLAIREKILGPEHLDVAICLNDLAALYHAQGKHAEAEPLYRRSLAIREKILGSEHPDVAVSLGNLAQLYYAQGQYGAAEPLVRRSLAIQEKIFGSDHKDVAFSLNTLAMLYQAQGKPVEAEPLFRRNLAILEKVLGPDHRYVAASLNNLAINCKAQGKYAEAVSLCRRSLAIWEKALGPDHPEVASSLNNLAAIYHDQGKYADAESLYRRSLAIQEKALGPDHAEVATFLSNLAKLYHDQGKYAEAESLYRRSLAIREKTSGPDHPSTGFVLQNYSALYYAWGRPVPAEALFVRCLENMSKQFEYYFSYMSERERLAFLDMVSHVFSHYYSFCLTYRDKMPALAGNMYDVLLWQKGFIAQSLAALRSQIAASGDPEALALLDRLAAKKTQLAGLLNAKPEDYGQWRKRIAQLEQEADELERDLVKRSSLLAEEKRLMRATWQDVQNSLKEGEAAVEIVRFDYYDGKRWTDRSYYVALIVTPKTTAAPELIVIGEATTLESAPLSAYRLMVSPEGPPASQSKTVSSSLYAAYWQPLEKALGDARRIYFSPDGIFNLLAWDVMPLPDGQLLLDTCDLRLVTNTKDLLRYQRAPVGDTAVLIGNPEFGLPEERLRAAAERLRTRQESTALMAAEGRGVRSREGGNQAIPPLPGTQQEVEGISSRLRQGKWRADIYCRADAVEEAIKQVRGPRVLHVATHGFFHADQKAARRDLFSEVPSGREDPMLRSGLLFAGAERTLGGNPPPADLDDGVFTAYEATGLNLQGTELVVLSACQTGLGQVKNGEGVFGLRRALQVAGAESVLMSLWSVPDQETQELMTLFYTKWLASQNKHEALRTAQQELRARVQSRYGADLPYYWGAFVLVGR